MIFMCKYSNEMMRSIKALEYKFFRIELECGRKRVNYFSFQITYDKLAKWLRLIIWPGVV